MWSVRARSEKGFNRAGIFWPNTETLVESVPDSVLNEPMLIVKEIKQEVHTDAISKPKTKTKYKTK